MKKERRIKHILLGQNNRKIERKREIERSEEKKGKKERKIKHILLGKN